MNNSIWETLRSKSREIETSIDTLERKRTGSYYTDLELTDIMMKELVSELQNEKKSITNYTFFEPCVGAGNFVFSYINAVNEAFSLSPEQAKCLLDNIYVADINNDALNAYKQSLGELVGSIWEIELSESYFNKHLGTGLLIDVTADRMDYITLDKVFPGMIADNKFDIVVTNPPYKNLKAERGHYSNSEEYESDKEKYSAVSKIITKNFKYAADGVLNLYKLFVEEIIDRYANEEAYVSLLIPASILSDKTCKKLRTHMLCDSSIISIKAFGEGCGYIDAQQALCAVLLKKGEKTTVIKVAKDYKNNPEEEARIKVEDILNENTGNAITAVSQEEYELLRKLRCYPVVRELDYIKNLRGELDLTSNKESIVNENTGYPLLRGRNIGYYELIATKERDYVLSSFVNETKKKEYIEKERIACQQIANMHKERRVSFSIVPEGYVLGNSCNFITVEDNDDGVDLFSLLGLFNTKIINWLFKLTSSNNHINNYEIDCFPVPTGSTALAEISNAVKLYLETQEEYLLEEIELLAAQAYEIDIEDSVEDVYSQYYENIKKVIDGMLFSDAKSVLAGEKDILSFCDGLDNFNTKVASGITKKYSSILNGIVMNHTTFKLSDLDLEMIKTVPQGGSWKDIPMETVEKSKRLKKITQTGGRTTLYGRIDYSKPSYTITTYFNRPGNGTYVHPIHERVLSVREAARFQTFPDDYYFYGNKKQVLNQVGNAVPTVLAYQIGKRIAEKTGCCKSIDLFCGAGGMTVGFKAAGINSLLSNDIEESACITLKINNPEIPVYCGDITKEETKDIIEKAAIDGGADLICGGPPCQGFSMAGFRSDTDPRNQLFREFVDIVKRVNPKVIVFENVEGLLSYQKGKTYKEVHTLFSELGYKTEGRTLLASQYSVPQKRKRVIIICTRNDLNINPGDLYPPTTTNDSKNQITARETIIDLEKVECSDTAKYKESYDSDLIRFFRGVISYEELVEGRSSREEKRIIGNIHAEENGQFSFL